MYAERKRTVRLIVSRTSLQSTQRLAISTLDGNHKIVLIGWAVVPSEDAESVLALLRLIEAEPAFGEWQQQEGLVVTTDRGRALHAAIVRQLPQAHHL